MVPSQNPRDLTPVEFERFVRDVLDQEGVRLEDYQSAHLEKIEAHDGRYEFDVTVRFCALGANFLVVVECKRLAAPIEREQVQALEQKRQSVHAQKAILFATSEFRSGAVDFAKAHGIALVQLKDGRSAFQARAHTDEHPFSSWLPPYAAWLIRSGENGTTHSSLGAFDSPFGRHESSGFLLSFLRGDSDKE